MPDSYIIFIFTKVTQKMAEVCTEYPFFNDHRPDWVRRREKMGRFCNLSLFMLVSRATETLRFRLKVNILLAFLAHFPWASWLWPLKLINDEMLLPLYSLFFRWSKLHCSKAVHNAREPSRCNVVTQFGDELYQCKDPDVRARGQRVKVLEFVNLEINNVSINSWLWV